MPVSSNDTRNPDISSLTPAGNIGLGDLIIDDLQNNIRKSLFVDPLGDVTDPVRSATENLLRDQEALKTQGASLGRQFSELIVPLVEATVDILRGRGDFPDIRVDGREVSIKQQSPLAKAQDLDDFQNSQIWFSNISQLPQEIVAASVKVEDLPGFWADKLGVPPSLMRSEDEKKQLAETVSQAAEAGIEEGL
jgi:hypothetical protein